MWSEHCSYKSSRKHLKKLPTKAPWVIQGPGENAGVIDVGDGQAVVFKMESHNHPSFIEPYQGAATGVGGICRDVFTMGARPIAIADCLRFGSPEKQRTAYLVSGVVSGIAGYGNSFGVPTVAGDVGFDESYDGNILVNAFCLGVAKSDKIFLAAAEGVGNPVVYVGAKTGRDGIHGATMASAEFDENSESKRPAVQVGDPFMEKLLLEACLELMASDSVVGIQDMGAAGLTSSSVEMAAKSGAGIVLDLESVPQRETGMTPYEICLSESQERMLMVLREGREQEALDIFAKWDLDAAVVGRVTDSGRVVIRNNGETFADLPAALLAEGLVYDRPRKRPAYLAETARLQINDVSRPSISDALMLLLSSPNIASKEWVFTQYDYNVRHGTVVRPGEAGAGVVRLPTPDGRGGGTKAVAISAGCNSRWVYLDPYEGTRLCVAEAYANLVAVGAKPLATTNCLNFGNPEKPEIMWQFAESVRGLGSACLELETPIISGNVSLYNETEGRAIRPTPMLGMVGVIENVENTATTSFAGPGQHVFLVGSASGSLSGSEYLSVCLGKSQGTMPELILTKHKPVFDVVRGLIADGMVSSAQDISDGGLLIAVSESCILGSVGADLTVPKTAGSPEDLLFGEGPARFVIAVDDGSLEAVTSRLRSASVEFCRLGVTDGDSLRISIEGSPDRIDFSVDDLSLAWRNGFRNGVERA